ncbi:ABC transporter ATP-binding protein [soil metagenome]
MTQDIRDVSIRVRGLIVDYEVFDDRRAGLRKRVATRSGSGRTLVHAVRGVSFDVYEGEAVGVIGSNGSGKSTMLAALAGLLPPSEGEILVSDEPKLLGVGATLLPAASGYRNIRLGCLALGMSNEQVEQRVDEIIEFTELGEAIDRPLRTYSSGMRARLHFAIATSVNPRILLIDEALAVGDRRFRRRSSQRIEAMLAGAGTVMMATHSPAEIRKQCSRALWIEQGELRADGPAVEVLREYRSFTG